MARTKVVPEPAKRGTKAKVQPRLTKVEPVKKAAPKKASPVKAPAAKAPKPTASPAKPIPAPKVVGPKAVPAKAAAVKAAPAKAAAPKAAAPKAAAPKAVAPKAASAKAAPPKPAKAPPKAAAPKAAAAPAKSAPKAVPAKAAPPAATKAVPAKKEAKMVNAERAERGAKTSVVRLVRGARPEKVTELKTPPTEKVVAKASPAPAPAPAPTEPRAKKPSPKIEVNPKLERSKHLVTTPAPAAPEPNKKPMSVAEKNRAQAEAVFARLSAAEVTEKKPEAAAPVELPFSARHKDDAQSNYLTRVSERDTITTRLRLASGRAEALAAAAELADRFSLPPDQGLLVKVMELGDQRLTKLALEELLELDDRGRVRGNPELRQALGRVKHKDPEIQELKQLFLEKLGGPV